MHLRVPHNAFLANFILARLKLRLDQAYHLRVRRQELIGRAKDFIQRDKGHIDRRELYRLCDIRRGHIAEVCLFHTDDTRIIAKLPRKLPVSYIDRIYFLCTILEHTVCKTACRSANIHANFSIQRDAKRLNRLLKL